MTDNTLLSAPWRHGMPMHSVAWHADTGTAVTLNELHARIAAWQTTLDGLAAPGQRWLLHHRDPFDFAAALIALWERGDSAVLPADDRPETLTALDAQTAGRLGDVADGHLPDHGGAKPRWGSLVAGRVAVSLYTSGSSGEPKRIDKTFAQLDAELATHAELWPLEGRLTISQVSHQHIYGLLFAILRPLCEGAPLAGATCRYPETLANWLMRLADARQGDSQVQAQVPPGAVLISAPPPLEHLPTELDWRAAPSVLARVYSSGAALSQAASEHAYGVLGVAVSEIYGSSETGGIAWRQQQRGECWTPLPGIEVRDDDHGCLWLRSPYLPSPGIWERQADRIALEGDGFRLLGRVDRIIKVGGKRLSLTGMDRALAAHPEVLQARTLALPRHDTRLGAIVQLRAEHLPVDHASRREMIAALRSKLLGAFEPTVIPRYWRFVESWPTNAQGKLSAELMARLFRDLDDRRQPRWLGVERLGDRQCRVTLEVPERLTYLPGHFDSRPVVPGVVMVQWACELAREHLELVGEFQRLERVKFARLLLPGERVTLTLAITPVAQGARLDFSLDGRHGAYASGKALFGHSADEREAVHVE
ncbi:Acyl-coenzyme A synthetase/AMP-(fatty) acid ligase [Modicisalibacter muralis]|uniref:Acyl-coenzyme A synthetase/AMP-(Fatty) acid ligase n=1 Tax=Modicisalibacter muralis TaxID=119000 RepID=A0A1G9HY89_9GAMM|nr:AMP-binding protein [Halomonas muralis]SDL17929.1 Acyl-coenzyme A synthetase/AMP-(fatty) acid ligase [Halomonas muralis]